MATFVRGIAPRLLQPLSTTTTKTTTIYQQNLLSTFRCSCLPYRTSTRHISSSVGAIRNKPMDQVTTALTSQLAGAVGTKQEPLELPVAMETVKSEMSKDVGLGKVFAVVHVAGSQYKVAENDLTMINKTIEADIGEVILLEKVLSVGCRTGTLVGMPLLKRETATVKAVVMEKTRGEKKIVFKKKKRKGYKKWQGHRQDLSVVKIKSIELNI